MVEQLLAPLRPDEGALTPLFQANVDDALFRQIAEADYGWEADKCQALLQTMLKTGSVGFDDFNLREVLELIRWSEPEDPEWNPGGQGVRGHWMRLFAATALVRLAAKYRDCFDGECGTLAQLISSAIELGRDVAHAAASMLAWRFLAHPGNETDRAFLAFAILLLAMHVECENDRGQWLNELTAWVEDEESTARDAVVAWSSEWLIGLIPYCLREALWRSLALRVLARPESPHPPEAEEDLRLLGELVAGI